jgi:hypothetical protein
VSGRAERATRAAAVAAVLLGLLAVVALTSSRERPRVSGGTDPGAVAQLRDVFLTVGATLYVVALVAAIWIFWKFRQTGKGSGPRMGLGSFFIFLLLAGGILWGLHNRPQPTQPGLNEIAFGQGQPQLQPPPAQPSTTKPIPPAEFRWEIAAGLLIAIALVIVAIVVVLRRRRPEDAELDPLERRDRVAAELASIVDGTIDDLRRERDPRRAVIAAYAQMEKALSNHGLPRERSEAPFEYLARMLRELRVRAASALALTELFERARFSHHVIDASMKDEAIDALIAVRDDLRAAPA